MTPVVTVRINGTNADACLRIVHDLQRNGFVRGVDFDFAYGRKIIDDLGFATLRYTDFHFYNENNATYFALRWGQNVYDVE